MVAARRTRGSSPASGMVTAAAYAPGEAALSSTTIVALWFTLAFERGGGRNLGFKLPTR